MSLDQLANIGEFLGGIAVFVSILYLIIELRTNTKAIKSTAYHQGIRSFAEMNEAIALDKEASTILQRAFDPTMSRSDFDDLEWFRLQLLLRDIFLRFEDFHIQRIQGVMEKEIWLHRRQAAVDILNLPVFKFWWEHEPYAFTPSFHKELISNGAPARIDS